MSEYRKDEIEALLSTATREVSCTPGAFYESLMDNGAYFHRAAPWKIVPGPWVLRVVFSGLERFVVITGATWRENKGLLGYRSLDDYEAGPSKACFAVKCEHSAPVFRSVSVPMAAMTAQDFIFLEVALRAVADFLTEVARMGGGGRGIGAQSAHTQALSASAVLDALCSRYRPSISHCGMEMKWMDACGDVFPCKQLVSSASSSTGDQQVSVHVVLTQSAKAQALRDVSRPVLASARVPAPLGADSSQCMVCLATESDVRSRSLCRMKLCVCKSPTEKYCCKECQGRDWPRHKRTCAHWQVHLTLAAHWKLAAERSQAEAEAAAPPS
jgi:hypothetical protein